MMMMMMMNEVVCFVKEKYDFWICYKAVEPKQRELSLQAL